MKRSIQTTLAAAWGHASTARWAWLWLVLGFLLLPFTTWQTVIPLAAWVAPALLLHFTRTTPWRRAWPFLMFAAYAVGNLIAIRGIKLDVFAVIGFPVFRGLLYTLPYAADRSIGSRLKGWAGLLVFPVAFTTVDWIMSLLPSVTTAGSPAYSQYPDLALMQLMSITGMWGVTFLIMWFASTANALWESGGAWRSALGKAGAFAAVLLAVFVFGSVRMTAWEPRSRTVPAAAVIIDRRVRDAASSQVNWVTFDRSTDAERAAARPRFQATVDDMLGRMETALLAGAKIVGCQETSAMVLEEDRQEVLQRASALARRYDAFLQVSLWVATRSASWPYVQNQSILIDNTGAIRASYEKTHPVAGGEAFIVFHGSSSLPLVETPQGKVCTAICNDMHFPALIREAGRGGADILIAPYDEIRPIESRAVASARAIENGVSLIRPTGNGVSLLTDYEGRVLGRLESARSTSGIVVTEIPTKGVRTVYAAVGDLFAYLCVAGLVALAVLALARRSRAAAPAHSA